MNRKEDVTDGQVVKTGRDRRRRHRRLDGRGRARSSSSGRCSTSRWSNPTRSARSASANRPSPPRAPSTSCSASTSASSCAPPRRPSSSASCSRTGARSATATSTPSARSADRPGWRDFHHFWLQAAGAGLRRRARRLLLRAAGGRGRQVRDVGRDAELNYAYHLDAAPLRAASCAALPRGQGVRRVEGKIAEVEQDPETGFIAALVLESGERDRGRPVHRLHRLSRAADRADARRPDIEDWSHWLPTDSALRRADRVGRPGRALHPRDRAPGRLAVADPAAAPRRQRPGLLQRLHVRRRGARELLGAARGRDADRAAADPLPRRPPPQGLGQELRRHRARRAASSSRWNRPAST